MHFAVTSTAESERNKGRKKRDPTCHQLTLSLGIVLTSTQTIRPSWLIESENYKLYVVQPGGSGGLDHQRIVYVH